MTSRNVRIMVEVTLVAPDRPEPWPSSYITVGAPPEHVAREVAEEARKRAEKLVAIALEGLPEASVESG
jgi:hypothetical protein